MLAFSGKILYNGVEEQKKVRVDFMKYEMITFREKNVLAQGRVQFTGENAISLPWCDSGFVMRFRGDGVIFHFGEYKADAPAYVRVWVDGKACRYAISDGREKVILENLGEAVHEVKLLRVTEGVEPILVTQAAIVGEAPELLAKPAEKPLKLAFIGDSITCGYGAVGPNTEPGYKTFEQDSSRSYAYMTAERLNAEIVLSGASGKGIVANCNGDRSDMTLRQAFAWANPKGELWDHSVWAPDLVVVNAGTNDAWGGISDEEFTETAVVFLGEIRKAYPGKPIVYCYGIMDTSKLAAVEKACALFGGEENGVYYFPVPTFYGLPEEVGGGGHPNTVTAVRVSASLAKKIKEVLGK